MSQSNVVVTIEHAVDTITMYEGCDVDVTATATMTAAKFNTSQDKARDGIHAICYNLLAGKLSKPIQTAIDADYAETHTKGFNKANGTKQLLINLLASANADMCRKLAICARFTRDELQTGWATRKANLKQVTVRSLNPKGISEGLKIAFPEKYAEVTMTAVPASGGSNPETPSLDADTVADDLADALQGRAEHAETAELNSRAYMLKQFQFTLHCLESIPHEWAEDYPTELGEVAEARVKCVEAIEYCKKGGKLPA